MEACWSARLNLIKSGIVTCTQLLSIEYTYTFHDLGILQLHTLTTSQYQTYTVILICFANMIRDPSSPNRTSSRRRHRYRHRHPPPRCRTTPPTTTATITTTTGPGLTTSPWYAISSFRSQEESKVISTSSLPS